MAALPGLGATSQMVSSASCNSANTPDAPNSSTHARRMRATGPGLILYCTWVSTSRTALVPAGPSRSASWAATRPATTVGSAGPNIHSAIGVTRITSGARARML